MPRERSLESELGKRHALGKISKDCFIGASILWCASFQRLIANPELAAGTGLLTVIAPFVAMIAFDRFNDIRMRIINRQLQKPTFRIVR